MHKLGIGLCYFNIRHFTALVFTTLDRLLAVFPYLLFSESLIVRVNLGAPLGSNILQFQQTH